MFLPFVQHGMARKLEFERDLSFNDRVVLRAICGDRVFRVYLLPYIVSPLKIYYFYLPFIVVNCLIQIHM